MNEHVKPYLGVRRIAITLGILFAIPSLVFGPFIYKRVQNQSFEYLIPENGSVLEQTADGNKGIRFATTTIRGNEFGLGAYARFALVGTVSALGVFAFIVLATCVAAEVTWWIRGGFQTERTLDTIVHPGCEVDDVAPSGLGCEELMNFEPVTSDFKMHDEEAEQDQVCNAKCQFVV